MLVRYVDAGRGVDRYGVGVFQKGGFNSCMRVTFRVEARTHYE